MSLCRQLTRQQVDDLLRCRNQGIRICAWNLHSGLRFDLIDEGLQPVEGADVVVVIDVLQCFDGVRELRVEAIGDAVVEVEVADLAGEC